MDLYIHSPIRLHGLVLSLLTTGTNLSFTFNLLSQGELWRDLTEQFNQLLTPLWSTRTFLWSLFSVTDLEQIDSAFAWHLLRLKRMEYYPHALKWSTIYCRIWCLTLVTVKRTVFWVVTVFIEERVQLSRGTYCLNLQDRRTSQARTKQKQAASLPPACDFLQLVA
jgi:hypothetical protein